MRNEVFFFFFQAEDGIRDRSPSRGLGDVYKRQDYRVCAFSYKISMTYFVHNVEGFGEREMEPVRTVYLHADAGVCSRP